MKVIGVLGGMSWESTAVYLRLLNEGVRDRLGGLHSARLRVATVDFHDIVGLQRSGDWHAAGDILAREARALEESGADVILIATNTMHKVYDDVIAAVSVPVLHLGDVTARAARLAGVRRVGLLATAYTIEQSFYRDRLAAHGVDSIVPDAADRAEVQRIIFDELCVSVVTGECRAKLARISAEMLARGAAGIVLGCTELESSLSAGDIAAPLSPTTTLHCAAALDLALT